MPKTDGFVAFWSTNASPEAPWWNLSCDICDSGCTWVHAGAMHYYSILYWPSDEATWMILDSLDRGDFGVQDV